MIRRHKPVLNIEYLVPSWPDGTPYVVRFGECPFQNLTNYANGVSSYHDKAYHSC